MTLTPAGQVFSGGVDATAATGSIRRFIVSGTWAAGDEIEFVVNVSQTSYELGKGPVYGLEPVDVMSYDNKVYVCADDGLWFSGLLEPTGWENRYTGFGFVRMSKQRGQAVKTLGVEVYNGKIALFARNVIKLWVPNADPALWQSLQTLDNTGTVSGKSITGVGDLDVFYVADSGVQSIRAREYTDLVNVNDVGALINKELRPIIRALSDADKEKIVSYYDVQDGRVWFFLPGYVYIFSYFPGSKVNAWTRYEAKAWNGSAFVAFQPTDITIRDGVPFLLKADSGSSKLLCRYPAATATRNNTCVVVIPFFAEKEIATQKFFKSIDVIGSGTWKLEVGDDAKDETSFRTVAEELTLPTVGDRRVPLNMRGTHLITKLTHSANEEAIISSVTYHYTKEKAT